MKPDKEKHLLLILLSAMGDAAMTAPVVKALREACPDLKITILTRPFFKPFFRNTGDIGFLEPDFAGRHKGMIGLVRLYRDIVACKVTDAADLHDVLRTKFLRLLLLLSGRRVSVIDKGRGDKRALTRKFRKFKTALTPTIVRYYDTVRRLGFDFAPPVPAVRKKLSLPKEILNREGRKEGIWIGMAPFAGHLGKTYPSALTVELLELLSARYDRVFIFGGGHYEQEFAEYMEERFANVSSAIGRMKLNGELDLISNLNAMVCMDSSAMHMASLVGVPAVSVWGATHPYAGFYGFGQDAANAVQLDMECRPCSVYGNKPCMYRDYRCMTQIAPSMIAEKVDEVLRKRRKRTAGRKKEETVAANSSIVADGVFRF